jgi:hypothetical protein
MVTTSRDRLQIDDALVFQRREWRFQRAGALALGAFVVLAALGAFGDGLLSSTMAGSPDGRLRIDYDRFLRAGALTKLVIHAAPNGDRDGGVAIELDRAYFDALRTERITPSPARISIGPSIVTLQFAAGGGDGLTVVIDAEPRHAGVYATAIRATGSERVSIRQFAYF